MLRHLRYVGGAPLRKKARSIAEQTLHATGNCVAQQRQTLSRLLELNQDSRFSKHHGLRGGMSTESFRTTVPVTEYADYEDAVDQLRRGDSDALLGRANTLLMFALSSGSTGSSKYVPVTKAFLADYRRGWQAWGIRTLDARPASHLGHFFQIGSDYAKSHTEADIPCGNISGLVAKMQSPVVRTMYSIPYGVMKIRDAAARSYTVARAAIADPQTAIAITANPSTLVLLAKSIAASADDLIRDLHDGTHQLRDQINPDVWSKYGRSFSRPNKARARLLDLILEDTGTLRPRDYWPHLQTIGVWTGGSCSAYLPTLREAFGDIPVRDHGLSASEGRMTIPFDDGTAAGILDTRSHYFEFIPAGEIESSSPTVLEAHDLIEGEDYFILLTTASGFVRYNIHDVVRCTGFVGTTPLVEFRHKGDYIANITGEKLTEKQFVDAVDRTLATRPRAAGRSMQFLAAPEWGDPPHYRLLIEQQDAVYYADDVVTEIDRRLRAQNCEYAEKRATERLGPLTVLPIPAGTWAQFAADRQQSKGGSTEQYKHPFLLSTVDRFDQFRADYVDRSSDLDLMPEAG